MTTKLAILIADLSGYTALTETHGPSAAAHLVDRYMRIVNDCLVGDSRVHQRVGDELMIVSTSADDLLSTSTVLLQTAHSEENFLLLHGGLHYGELLLHNDNFFGTAINLTSRIAAAANAGSIWCSQPFIQALSGTALTGFISKGLHSLKNLSEEEELFDIQVSKRYQLHIDPVCRMLIVNEKNAFTHPSAPGVFFCSENCANIFLSKNIHPV